MRERGALVTLALMAAGVAGCTGAPAPGSETPDPTPATAPATAPAPSVVASTAGPSATTPASAPSVATLPMLGDVPGMDVVAGPPRASLSIEPSTSTAHVHRVVTAGDALVVVGSTESYGIGGWPTIWRFDSAPDALNGTVHTPFSAASGPPENGSAVDAAAMPDGTLLVLGWLSDGSEPRSVLWRFRGDDATGSEVHRFAGFELGGSPERLVVDDTGRPWVVAKARGLDGAIDVATQIGGEWITSRLGDGVAFDVHVAPTAAGVEVFASRITFGPDGGVVHAALDRWESTVSDLDIVTTNEVFPPETGISDLERMGDTMYALVTQPTGQVELWQRDVTMTAWSATPVPRHPSEAPMAITFADTDPVVLLLGPEGPDDRSQGRAVRVRDGVADDWSGGYSIDFQTGPETSDYPATTWQRRPVLIDRRAADTARAIVLDDAGTTTTDIGIPRMFPDHYDRVDELRPTPQGMLAVVSRVNAGPAGNYFLGEGYVTVFGDAGWTRIADGQIELSSTWNDSPIFLSSNDTGMDQYVLGDGRVDLLATVGGTGRVSDVAVFGATIVVAGTSGGMVRPFVGPVGGPVTELDGFPNDVSVLEICDGTVAPTFVVAAATGERSLVAATEPGAGPVTVAPDGIVAFRPVPAGDARPFCWQGADGTLRVLQDAPIAGRLSTLVVTAFDDELDEISFGAPRWLPPGVQAFDAVATADGELVVGRVSDRWGSWDAAVLRFDGNAVELVAVFGGNGRQEARTIARAGDGWLVGGTDNGEAVAWKLSDG